MTVILKVGGMTCGACTASITEALEKIPGVDSASVSLITEEAKITCKLGAVDAKTLLECVEGIGFEAEVLKDDKLNSSIIETTVIISGMTCGSCSASVTEALEELEGVENVSISLITETGLIKHTATTQLLDIIETIENCGFGVEIQSTKNNLISTRVSIQGMTCGACTASITEALENSLDVTKASVSLTTEEALITHSKSISPSQIVQIIEDCGFDVQIIGEEDDEHSFEILGEITADDGFQYNLEAMLSNLGIVDYVLEEDQTLTLQCNPQLGVRNLLDLLNTISPDKSFIITNSLDQALLAQLKLLSRVKDVQYWKHNFFKSIIFGLPVLALSYAQNYDFWKPYVLFPGFFLVSLLQFLFTLHVYVNLGSVFLSKFGKFIKNKGKNATMDVLVCISTLVSFTFSILSITMSVWNALTTPPTVLFETVCMLVIFVSFGKWLENKAKGATSTALSKLLSLTPTSCTIVVDPKAYVAGVNLPTRTVGVDLIQTNDIAIVLPGAKVPADGLVCYGSSEIDESLITGESLPVFKEIGDSVIGGSINGQEVIHIKVVSSGKKSQLQQIINLVKESQVNKAPVQRFADYVAARFVPGVVALSIITLTVWAFICKIIHPDSLPMAFRKDENGKFFVCLKLAISVVVVACPCALGLAAPTAVMVGTGVGASHGVLIKGGDVLEEANSVNIILFDKTGTLTTGKMEVVDFTQKRFSDIDFWNLVGAVEFNSEHPIGEAITQYALNKVTKLASNISNFKNIPGLGVRAEVKLREQSYNITIGNQRMITQDYPHIVQDEEVLKELRKSTNTLAHVIVDNEYIGYIQLTDSLKKNARQVIDHIRNIGGYQVGIVTGDSRQAATKIGKELGIPECNVFSEVSPVNKDKVITDLKERLKGGVAFVGDGINDAPALAKADIGIALSSGTDIAMESADIVILSHNDDLTGVVNALKIANATFTRVKLNFIWAAIYNVLMLPFAMGCFLPFNMMLPPVAAAGAMALSSVSVVMSSLMLKRWTPPVLNTKESYFRYDLENNVQVFDLKNGTESDFNLIKRNRSTKMGVVSFITRIYKGGARTNDYEMLPV